LAAGRSQRSDPGRGSGIPRRLNGDEGWRTARDLTVELAAGQLLVLEPEVAHSLEAVEESAFLLAIAFRGHPDPGDSLQSSQ
jgi:hypothetical protein